MRTLITIIASILMTFNVVAQENPKPTINYDALPHYVVVTSENTKLIGGINIIIDAKKSPYQDVLSELEHALQNRKKMRIRCQTDLLNAMYDFGFEYINAYNARSLGTGIGGGDDIEIFGSDEKYRINMVFRKKETSF